MNLFWKDKEQQMLELFKKDPDRGMNKLYTEYADYLMGVCARYIPDKDERKDVLQECFIKIFTQITQFEYKGKGALKAWITRIAINEALLSLRKEKQRAIVSYEEERLADLPEEEPEVTGLSAKDIIGLIQQLPDGYRAVFNLYAIEGKSHKEIAEILHIKADSSASQYHRAKQMMAKLIKEFKTKQSYR